MVEAEAKPSTVEVVVIHDASVKTSKENHDHPDDTNSKPTQQSLSLTRFHARYFTISLSLGAQALLWKNLTHRFKDMRDPTMHPLSAIPSLVSVLIWWLSLLTVTILSFLYILKCFFHFSTVKAELSHHIGVNYLYVPWTSWLLLLQSSPVIVPNTLHYHVLSCAFATPILFLDLKIYGQWITTEKRFLSVFANPTGKLSVIANLVAAQVTAEMGWIESAVLLYSLAMAHYLVLFVTLYQRLTSSNPFPVLLSPAYFLFFAAPSVASLSWKSISGAFQTQSKMLFFLSLFLFMSLVCRPTLFKKSLKKLTVAWWAYSFPLTLLCLASTEYAQEVKGNATLGIMLVLAMVSVSVFVGLILVTAHHIERLLQKKTRPQASLTF